MAIANSGNRCELREVVLRDKPAAMLEVSAKGTVPVLVLEDRVLDESLDIMKWALAKADPSDWLGGDQSVIDDTNALLEMCDSPFKQHLDRYKYSTRYDNVDAEHERSRACSFIANLETRLADNDYLLGPAPRFADVAIFPFIRQFAGADRTYWEAAPFPNVRHWLERWCDSELFKRCMKKYPTWAPDQPESAVSFPLEP